MENRNWQMTCTLYCKDAEELAAEVARLESWRGRFVDWTENRLDYESDVYEAARALGDGMDDSVALALAEIQYNVA